MEQVNDVTVNFFEGKQKTLWLIALFLSFALAVSGWLLGFLIPVKGIALRIIFLIVAVAGTGILLVCLITAKMRTSKWTANQTGITYSAFGIRLSTLEWRNVKQAGLLRIINPRTNLTAFYLYWSEEDLMSACRNFIKGGSMEHKPSALGKYNCRKGNLILYALDPHDPANDPMLRFTQEKYSQPLKNPKVLNWAVENAEE